MTAGAADGLLAPMVAWIESTTLAAYVRESSTVFPWLEVAHVIGLSLVLGTIAIVDLRLIGVAGTDYPVRRLMRTLLPITWVGFLLALVTGLLMFASQPVLYLATFAFQLKLALLLLAGANMAIFHLWTQRGIGAWNERGRPPLAARISGLLSLGVWIGVVFAGRFVGFTIDPFGF